MLLQVLCFSTWIFHVLSTIGSRCRFLASLFQSSHSVMLEIRLLVQIRLLLQDPSTRSFIPFIGLISGRVLENSLFDGQLSCVHVHPPVQVWGHDLGCGAICPIQQPREQQGASQKSSKSDDGTIGCSVVGCGAGGRQRGNVARVEARH